MSDTTPDTSPTSSLPSPRGEGTPALVLGAALLAVAVAGAGVTVRRLDVHERVVTVTAPAAAAWTARADGQRELAVPGALSVPRRGALRLKVCARGPAAPDVSMEVRGPGGRVLARERLTREQSTSRRCVGAQWRSEAGGAARVTLVAKAAPVDVRDVTARAGVALGAREMWPVLLLALGVGLVVLGPGRRGGVARALASPDELPWASQGRGGLALALVSLLLANGAAQAPVLAWGLRGATMLASVVLQQCLLALVAAALVGALRAERPRAALELEAPEEPWLRRAVGAASVLLAVAMAVAATLSDAGDSPIGRAVEATPTRYVIAFGALAAPLPEELFFRAALGRIGESAVGRRSLVGMVLVPAAVFTSMHALQLQGALVGLAPIAALALVNGWLRWSTRGIAAPWLVHTIYNGVLALSALA